jgi:hypothetical protein
MIRKWNNKNQKYIFKGKSWFPIWNGVMVTHHFHFILVWNKDLFHMSNVDTSPNFVKQKFFFQSGKIKSQMVDNRLKLITTNWRSCKPDVIDFLPFRSQTKKKRAKTWLRPNNKMLTCKFFECWNDILDGTVNIKLMLIYRAFDHIDAPIFWNPLTKPQSQTSR